MLSAVRRQNLANKSKINSEIYLYQSLGSPRSRSDRRRTIVSNRRDGRRSASTRCPMASFGAFEATKATTPREADRLPSLECMLFYGYRASRQPCSGASSGGKVASSTPSRGRKRFHFRWAPKGSHQRILLHSSLQIHGHSSGSFHVRHVPLDSAWPRSTVREFWHVLTERLTHFKAWKTTMPNKP
jgi:hypothetical protein